MSGVSPLAGDTSLVSFTIEVEGSPIDSSYQVLSIETWSSVNKVPKARLVLYDGSPAEGDFEISNLETFLPGKPVTVAAGYNGDESTVFEGVVVKQGLEISRNQASKLVVDLSDKAVKMTLERKSAAFEEIKDSDLISQLISSNGLSSEVASTDAEHEKIVQYHATDWDLMLTRAELNGFVVVTEAGKVTVEEPDSGQSPDLKIEYGDTIFDLTAEMDATTQYQASAFKGFSWDAAKQKLVEASAASVSAEAPGNVSPDELAQVFGVASLAQRTAAPLAEAELGHWAAAALLKSKLSKVRGTVSFQGSALAHTGKTLELAGLGERFNGTAFVSGVNHRITGGHWQTRVVFGLSPKWFVEEASNVAVPLAAGQLPPIRGLHPGVVQQIADDPAGGFRVLVTLPLTGDDKGVWARLGTFYASDKVGAVFYPEVGDEVVVGFLSEDPRFPVILGSLYSKKHALPETPEAKNSKKAIVTKSELKITFDDENKVLEIATPGGHTLKLDDQSAKITLEDSNGNTLETSASGVKLESAANLDVKAQGNISIEAQANLALKATANATFEGLQIEQKAQTKYAAQGSVATEITSPAMLTLRGALVKIN